MTVRTRNQHVTAWLEDSENASEYFDLDDEQFDKLLRFLSETKLAERDARDARHGVTRRKVK